MDLTLNVPSRRILYTSGPQGETFHCQVENTDSKPYDASKLKFDVDIPDTISVEGVSHVQKFPIEIYSGHMVSPGNSFSPTFRVRRSDITRDEIYKNSFTMYLFYDGELVDEKEIKVQG